MIDHSFIPSLIFPQEQQEQNQAGDDTVAQMIRVS